MKRILFVVSSMQGGGAERVAALLCNYWAALGHEVLLVITFSGRGECVYPLHERVRLEYLADRVATTSKTPWSLIRRLWVLRVLAREFQPNAVLSFMAQVNVATLLATWRLGVRTVVAERTYPPAMDIGFVWSWLRRFTYPWAALVVMQTRQGLAWLTEEMPQARGSVIPNPCVFPLPPAAPYFEPGKAVSSQRFMLMGAGRLGEEKGFETLIQTFDELAPRFPDWDLVILGEGNERDALEKQIVRLGLNDRVFLPGRTANLGDWFERADLYVMSSRFEGFPNTLLEALAYGVPAVSFDCETGPSDIIRDGIDGVLVPPVEGAAGLAREMAAMMQDEDRRQRMGKAAVAVQARFSPERVMAEWDKALDLGNGN